MLYGNERVGYVERVSHLMAESMYMKVKNVFYYFLFDNYCDVAL